MKMLTTTEVDELRNVKSGTAYGWTKSSANPLLYELHGRFRLIKKQDAIDYKPRNRASLRKPLINENIQKKLIEIWNDRKDTLTPNERIVLKHRYALDDCETQTLAYIGEMLNRTRQRISDIEKSGLEKLGIKRGD